MKKFFFIIMLLTSCSNNTSNKNSVNNCPEINPLEITKEISNIDEYIGSVEMIDVNKGSEYYNIDNTKKIIVLENSDFILFMGSVVKFDRLGNTICNYGNIGKGNGEYLKLYDICLNSDKTELWALDYKNQLMKYNLQNGKYLGTYKIDYLAGKISGNCDGIIPSNDNGLYLLSLNDPGATKINYNYSYLSHFDKKGAFIKSELQLKDFNVDYPYSPYISYSFGKYIIRPQENDNICYMVENGELSPFLKIHYGDKNIEPLFAFKDGGNLWEKFADIINSDSYKHVMNIQLTNKHIFFSTLRPSSSQESFLINLGKKSGIRWSHKLANVYPFFIIGSDKEYLYGVYTYLNNHDNIAVKDSPLINYIVKNCDKNKEGEPILLKIKFK